MISYLKCLGSRNKTRQQYMGVYLKRDFPTIHKAIQKYFILFFTFIAVANWWLNFILHSLHWITRLFARFTQVLIYFVLESKEEGRFWAVVFTTGQSMTFDFWIFMLDSFLWFQFVKSNRFNSKNLGGTRQMLPRNEYHLRGLILNWFAVCHLNGTRLAHGLSGQLNFIWFAQF